MVLAELGSKITGALRKMTESTIINEEVIDEMLKEICNALVQSDVNFNMVLKLRQSLKAALNLSELADGINRRNTIRKAVGQELIKLVDAGKKPFKPTKGRNNIFMFVGLQGSGKTTTIAKLAHYYKRKGWNPALVCADTFRAGAFDQLKQNAAAAKVPYYGSYFERDPVKLAQDGVAQFKKDGHDIIIVDTSGRHKQEANLFEEMEQVASVVKPDQIVFVMDGSIGQAAYDQAEAFKNKVAVGAVVMTKLDGHAKGGGALAAVAATQSPIIFLGTGEHLEDLDEFEPGSFISRLLGWGDTKNLVNLIKEAVPGEEKQKEMVQRLQEGKFSLRDMYEQFQSMMKMGPLGKVMEMIPGMGQLLQGKGDQGQQKIKAYLTIMDSMTDEELDSPKVLTAPRIARIARGAGRPVREVQELLTQHKQFEKVVEKMKGMKNGRMGMNQIQSMIPPHLLKQMGGAASITNMMKQMGAGGMPGLFGK